jgi:hypothetical protein
VKSRNRFRLVLLLLAAASAPPALADGFAALVSPPRFELQAKPGQTIRSVVEITNRATTPAQYQFHTADWTISPEFAVTFHDPLQPGSCRDWVALERHEAVVPGGATMRYRFEVAVPKDAPVGECHFGVLIEGKEPSLANANGLQLPVSGRIGVIVYVTVGNAVPHLEVFGPKIVTVNGQKLPTLRVHNSGDAHGRMSGFLSGTDAKGAKYDFNPSDFPILPGDEADVYLVPSTPTDDHPTLTFPVTITGTLEWGQQKAELHQQFQ